MRVEQAEKGHQIQIKEEDFSRSFFRLSAPYHRSGVWCCVTIAITKILALNRWLRRFAGLGGQELNDIIPDIADLQCK